MAWLDETLDLLAKQPICGYAPAAAPATEPTALAALALHANQQGDRAQPALQFLARIQAADGSVGVREGEPTPGWPTSLAVVAWQTAGDKQHKQDVASAVAWILAARGETMPRSSEFGHDTQIAGWSYADQTHSWIEPTALHVTALKAAGQLTHARTRDGVRMLIDRQLPAGGCNYGNTMVLGQMLRPHVQPTGIALLALAGEQDTSGRIAKSLAWLRRSMGRQTTATSLAWGLLGLQAHGVEIGEAEEWLEVAHARVMRHDRSPHKLALLALAAKGWPA
jgi:hypothetical protein